MSNAEPEAQQLIHVVVKDIDIKFMSIVALLLKVLLAAIPLYFILIFVESFFAMLLSKFR